ncbi:MAG TPA: hypothetical protein PKI11_04250 [Candidatus Hydrogenedentes bacterium]|nr:hypothetical protein [Candidatus Hydrogenedentota bacterium]
MTGEKPEGGWEAVTPQGDVRVAGAWAVVDAGTLVTSSDEGYDQRLQERNRNTQSSREQIASIALAPDFSRLTDAPTTDVGAPMIDDHGQVVSGNGRVLGLRQAYATRKAAAYRKAVIARARELGLGLDAEAMKQPVLVRRMTDTGGVSIRRVAELSNRPQVLQMTEAEQAGADAAVLEEKKLMGLWRPDAEGNVHAASNREFMLAFVRETGAEHLRTSDGGFTPGAAARVRRAVLALVLRRADVSRETIAQAIEEAEPLGLVRIVNGIMASGGNLLRVAQDKPPLDLSRFLGQALAELMAYKHEAAAGRVANLGEYLAQEDMFATERAAETLILMRELNSRTSAAAVRAFLDRYVELAGAVDTTTESLFGESVPETTVRELLEIVQRETEQRRSQEPRQLALDEGVQGEIGRTGEREAEPAEPAGAGRTRDRGEGGGREGRRLKGEGGRVSDESDRSDESPAGREEDTGERFSVREGLTAAEELGRQTSMALYDSGRLREGDMVRLSNAPSWLRMLGAGNAPLVVSQRVMRKIGGRKHQLSREIVEALPAAIADPVAVFREEHGRYSLVTDLLVDGKPIVVAIQPDAISQNRPVHLLLTAHPANLGQIATWKREKEQAYQRKREEAHTVTGEHERLKVAASELPEHSIPDRAALDKWEREHLSATEREAVPPGARIEYDAATGETRPAPRDTEGRLSESARPEGGMRVREVEEVVRELRAAWPGAPRMVVVETADGLPEGYRHPRAWGLFTPAKDGAPDTVYLVAGQMRRARDVVKVAWHEVIGHWGLRSVLGAETYKHWFGQLWHTRNGEIRAWAKEHGHPIVTPAAQLRAAEEWLAWRVTRGEFSGIVGWWKRFTAAVRRTLAPVWEGAGVEAFSDQEIAGLVKQAWRLAEGKGEERRVKGEGDRVEASVYSKGAMPAPDLKARARLRNQLQTMRPVQVDASAFGDKHDPKRLREMGKEAFRKLVGTEVVNDHDGRRIGFSMKQFKKPLTHSADPRIMRAVASLPELLRRAVRIATEVEHDQAKYRNIKYWHTYIAPAVLDGEQVFVTLSVFELKDGTEILDFYHDHNITNRNLITKGLQTGPQSFTSRRVTPEGLSRNRLYHWWHGLDKPQDERFALRKPTRPGQGDFFEYPRATKEEIRAHEEAVARDKEIWEPAVHESRNTLYHLPQYRGSIPRNPGVYQVCFPCSVNGCRGSREEQPNEFDAIALRGCFRIM